MMTILRRAVLVCLLLPVVAFAQSADQEILLPITDSPDPVIPGQNITYTVSVRNNGPDPAVNGGVNASFAGTTYVSASGPAGFACAAFGSAVSCTNPSFPAGQTAVITFIQNVPAHLLAFPDGTVTASFSTSGTTVDPVLGNNGPYNVTTAYDSPQVDLALTVSDSPDPVFPNGNVTFTVDVINNGPDDAPEVNFNVVNGSFRFVSATLPAPWTCTLPAVGGNPTFTCNNDLWPSGTAYQFTVVLNADPAVLGTIDTPVQTYFGVASSGGLYNETNHANNDETEITQYVTPDADLSIGVTDSPDPVANGGLVTFDISVENGGPDDAPGAVATFSPHPSLTFQSLTAPVGWSCTTPPVGSAGVTQCNINPLPNGAVAVFQLVTQVVAAGAGGVLNSSFSISSNVQDPNLANNNATVFTTWIGATSDLAISKSTLESAVAQGGTITYTISTSNNGPDDATSVTVTDTLHPALLFQSLTAPVGWSCTTPAVGANGTITCTAATLANGATAELTLVTTVAPNATGSIPNSATVSGANDDPNAGNNSGASSGVTVAGNADLSVTKTTDATSASPGDSISYTITVTNAGPSPATNVVVTDDLPAGLTLISATPSQGTCNASDPVTCNLGTIANGGSATIALSTQVTATSGTIVNTASVTSTEGDTDSSTTAPVPVAAAEVAAIPTASEWGLMILAAMLAIAAAMKMRT